MLELLLALIASVTGIDRTFDGQLAASAQARTIALECGSNDFYTHAGKPKDSAEILICFPAEPDPAGFAVNGWMASAPHRAVLLDAGYTHIGCGVTQNTAGGYLFACELARGPHDVPNTATVYNPGLLTATGLLLVVAASIIRQRRSR